MAHKNKTNISPYTSRQSSSRTTLGTHKKPENIYSLDEAADRLRDTFQNHGFGDISHSQRHQLAQFYRLLMENQEKENFTRLLKFRDIAIKHFIDCLIVARMIRIEFPLMDVGTGPGFPGMPLKILYPQEQIILAEGVQRRVEFLKNVREQMKLQKLDILGRNINSFCAYPTQSVITRAVEDVGNTLRNVLTCLNTNGVVYLMKGPNVGPEIEAFRSSDHAQYYRLEADHKYNLPETPHERRLLVYRKIKPAPVIDFEDEPWPGEFNENTEEDV